jgi:DNA-binding NtrC family response regulator
MGDANIAQLLVVDDEAKLMDSIRKQFRSASLELAFARTGRDGLASLQKTRPDVVILGGHLADMPGLELFNRILEIDARLPVIFMTAHAATETAIEAMKRGAFEYLLKPVDLHQLRAVVDRALALHRHRLVPGALTTDGQAADVENMVGRSSAMQEVYKAIGRVAPSDVRVLILGESGTGKELVARAIFQHSGRKEFPFLAINCAAISETLLESELFGHERGAFTGAYRHRLGKFEQAHRGTLFLDEIGDMSLATQAKMLRLRQEQKFERLGGNDSIQTDVRLIAATNKDLAAEVAAGRLRSDLYYRLNVFTIHIPPLRERGEDIGLLIDHYLPSLGRQLGRNIQGITPEARRCMLAYHWPGNVRQLQSVLKYAIVQSSSDVLPLDCLPQNLRSGATPAAGQQPTPVALHCKHRRFCRGAAASGRTGYLSPYRARNGSCGPERGPATRERKPSEGQCPAGHFTDHAARQAACPAFGYRRDYYPGVIIPWQAMVTANIVDARQ